MSTTKEQITETKVNEVTELATDTADSPRPALVSFPLTNQQLAAVNSLYEGRKVGGNGGRMFGVLGEVVIDQRRADLGIATFHWLNDGQYRMVRDAICQARSTAAGQQRHLVHTARQMFETRIAKFNDPNNLEWDWEDLAAADKWQRHAFSAFLDLVTAEKERDAVMDALRLVLPMAKAYAKQNAVGSNKAYVAQAEQALMNALGITEEDIEETRNPAAWPV